MKRGAWGALLVTGIWSIALSAAEAEVRTITYQNRENCIELTNGTARLVIAPEEGGRVVHYSVGDGPDFFLGGFQMDIGPELDYPPSHRPLWSGPYEAETLGRLGVQLTSIEDKPSGIQMTKVIELGRTGALVTVRSTMTNIGDRKVAYCFWDRTMSSATYGFFQLNPKSRFPDRWSVREGKSRSFRYKSDSPSSPRVKIVGDLLVTVPGDKTEKVGADSMAGWIAGFHDGWLYVKRFPVFPKGDYADGGNTVEFWVDSSGTRTEIEPLSPKVELFPGESCSFVERWELRPVDTKITGAEDIPKLVPHVDEMARKP